MSKHGLKIMTLLCIVLELLTESSQVKIFVSCHSSYPSLPSSMLVVPAHVTSVRKSQKEQEEPREKEAERLNNLKKKKKSRKILPCYSTILGSSSREATALPKVKRPRKIVEVKILGTSRICTNIVSSLY